MIGILSGRLITEKKTGSASIHPKITKIETKLKSPNFLEPTMSGRFTVKKKNAITPVKE
jgi:hypothetical protein